jgi:DNA-directed RNA polymerase subunit RPC12/RpoP
MEQYFQELDYFNNPRFCPECISATTDESAGDIVSVNYIFGEQLIDERREECPVCGSETLEKTGSFLRRKASYKVIWLDSERKTFISRKLKINYNCDHCGHDFRFPDIKKEILKITCPNCEYIFYFKNGKKIKHK